MKKINYQQLSQYLQNNLWYGENDRHKNLVPHISGVNLLGSSKILSLPDEARVFGIDISHWNVPPVNLKRMVDLFGLKFVIIKGCDGSLNTRYYTEHVEAAKLAGIPWGMYVWLYPNNKVSMDAQINAWHTRANIDPPPMGIFIDAEWTSFGGQSANPTTIDLRLAHDKWKAKSGNPAITYTAKGYASQYLVGFDWNREGLWIANYGVTSPALPIGASTYKFWQFTSTLDGKQLDPNGNAELDGNYYNGTHQQFQNEYKTIADGYQHIRRYESDIHLYRGSYTRAEITDNYSKLIKPSEFVSTGATVIINGDGWWKNIIPYPYKPLSLAVSEGYWVQDVQFDERPFINWKNNGTVIISSTDKADAKNLVSGTRYSIKAGVNNFINSTDPEHITERHPRSAIGYTKDGKIVACVVDGRSVTSQGTTLYELAEIMLSTGCWYALELDGGDSSIMLMNGIQVSHNGDLIDGIRTERPTVNSILLFTEEETMANFNVISNKYNMTLRIDHNSGAIGYKSVPVNTPMQADEIWVATQDLYKLINGVNVKINSVGDKWAHIIKAGSVVENGWTAIVHNGVIYCTYEEIIIPPPPDTEGLKVNYASQEVFPQEGRMRWSVRRNNGETTHIDYPI